MSRTSVRRLAAAALVLPLLLGGCSDDDPEPDIPDATSPSASVTETTAEPTEPEQWERRSDEGAVAFAKHWVDLLNEARLGADFEPVRSASDKDCNTCSSFFDVLEQLHGPGGLYESKPWRVVQTGVIASIADNSARVALRIKAPAERVRAPGEKAIRKHAATTETYEASLVWAGAGWTMQELVIPG